MSKTSERFRSTTQKLLAQDRQFAAAREFLLTLSPSRRASLAAALLASIAAELEPHEPGLATRHAMSLHLFAEQLSQRAITGSAPGEQSRDLETQAAATVPSTGPSAVISARRNGGMTHA